MNTVQLQAENTIPEWLKNQNAIPLTREDEGDNERTESYSRATLEQEARGEMVLSDADTAANWPNGISNTQGLLAVNL